MPISVEDNRRLARSLGPLPPQRTPHSEISPRMRRSGGFLSGVPSVPIVSVPPGDGEELSEGEGPVPVPSPPDGAVLRGHWEGFPFAVHFSGSIVGGEAASEMRVIRLTGARSILKSLTLLPVSGVAVGQFLQVYLSNDLDAADTETPSGVALLQTPENTANLPGSDVDRGIAIPLAPLTLQFYKGWGQGDFQSLKFRLYFRAPAVGLPQVSLFGEVYYQLSGAASGIVPVI